MSTQYSELQLDALQEIANIGSGTAATALSTMLGRTVDVSVPNAAVLPLADAVDAAGPPDALVTGVVVPIAGVLQGHVLLLFDDAGTRSLCSLLGVDADSDVGVSALGEIANILGSSYLGAIVTLTGMEIEPRPPQTATDLLAAIVATVLAETAHSSDTALVLDSALTIDGAECALTFMLVPTADGIGEVLRCLGLGA